ncbi:unnamed protein product [Adineta steineri]|uniref:C2 domain-containing protein n=1 Tax=Adineta steineri TaxID=433720 RepID=A0A814A6A8_9BILA|nr:unnamed protein product [Adineta steineri]
MSSNGTNATVITTSVENAVPWSAIIFLLLVAFLLIIAIVLILYFEKLCCFGRYRFLKHLLRRITRTKRIAPIPATTQTSVSVDKPEEEINSSTQIQEYLWIAGHSEHISTFEPTEPLITDEFSTDLPDDDYTTLVPPVKQMNGANRKLPQVPIIVEEKENGSTSSLSKITKSNRKTGDQQKTAIAGISKRKPNIDNDLFNRSYSAPSSPALSHHSKQRLKHKKLIDPNDIDAKSISSDQGTITANGPSSSLLSGALEVRLKFDAKNSKMWVFVIKATLEMNQRLTKQSLIQIHLTMLPNKRIRFRTRAKPADNAMFAEEFFCKVSPDSIQTQGIRFRLYTNERFKREKLLAEATIMFGLINLDEDMCKIVPLERASEESDSANNRSRASSNAASRRNSITTNGAPSGSLLPELEIGLAYDRTQSTLILEIGKGVNFGMTSQGRAPDTFAQMTLLNTSGEEMLSNRTVTRRTQHHPIYAERYPFNIQEHLLDQITLVITIINKKPTGKNDRNLGWISFGHGASGNTQVAHWDSMLNAQGETITRWHALLES